MGLGHGNTSMLAEPVLTGLADKHGRSVAQVLLRWHLQSGFVAIPKSTSPEHITENLDVFDFALTEADMAAIAQLDTGRANRRMPRWLQRHIFAQFRPRQLP